MSVAQEFERVQSIKTTINLGNNLHSSLISLHTMRVRGVGGARFRTRRLIRYTVKYDEIRLYKAVDSTKTNQGGLAVRRAYSITQKIF